MEWHFVNYCPDETTHDPIVGDSFLQMQSKILFRLLYL
jgi:hypothetical protein